jgi:hypothetical protein
MTEVKIPFLERFREPMLNGAKYMTTRTKKYGDVGDTFEAFGAVFVIEGLDKLPLAWIVDAWKAEGCQSKDDFLNVWRQIHPNRTVDLKEKFWVHYFRKLEATP